MRKLTNRTRNTRSTKGASPTKERCRQNGGVRTETIASDTNGKGLIKRYRAVWTSPLDAYKDLRIITDQEYMAGGRFHEAYYKAVLSRGATRARLNNYPTLTNLTASEKILKDAYRTLPPYNRGIIIDICGHDQPTKDPLKLNALKKGLGNLALRWNMAALEVTERKC